MKSTIALITILSLYAVQVLAAPACDVEKFKKQYIELQNALRYDGKKIDYKNGKITPSKEEVSNEDTPGKKTERALYNNYLAALGKVKKIYEHLNSPDKVSSDEKTVLANNDVTKFFKAIDPNTSKNPGLDVNIEKLVDELKKVKGKEFSLSENDAYLLKKLLVHSQDRVCTLENYLQSGKATQQRKKYLDDLKVAPLNKMIDSLKKMVGTEDVKFADQDLAIEEAVKEGIENLHKMALDCKGRLNAVKFDEPIQACNFNKLVKSLSVDDNSFRSFEAILHFINANQTAKNARTSLNWLNEEFDNKKPISCILDAASKTIYVKNLPVKDDTVDPKAIKCTKNDKEIRGNDCIQGMTISFTNGKGHSFTAKQDSGIQKLSIANAANCANISFNAPVVTPPIRTPQPDPVPPKESEEQKCKKDPAKEWINNKCVAKTQDTPVPVLDLFKCSEDECRNKITINGRLLNWNAEKKVCIGTLAEKISESRPVCSPEGRTPETEESCKKQNKDFNDENKSCIETEASCKATKLAFDPAAKKCIENANSCKEKSLGWDEEKKICTETSDSCKKKNLSYDNETKACVESAETCKTKNKDYDAATKTCKDPAVPAVTEDSCKKQDKKYDAEKKICVDLTEEEKCKKRNEDWINGRKDGEEAMRTDKYEMKNNVCVDKKESKAAGTSGDGNDLPEKESTAAPAVNKPVPGRFQPMSIPTRQMFIMPGMP